MDNNDLGRSGVAVGLSSDDGAASVSALRASIPNADENSATGSVFIGVMPQPLRNGSRNLIMFWEAERRPVKVCEGGGWYSKHATQTAWVFRSWMAHKGRPGWALPDVADERDDDLAMLVERAFDSALVKHGFTSAQAIEARRAETGTGSVHESAVAKPCAQGDPQ